MVGGRSRGARYRKNSRNSRVKMKNGPTTSGGVNREWFTSRQTPAETRKRQAGDVAKTLGSTSQKPA